MRGDRRGGQRQRVDFGSQLAQLLLGRHAELLLLVDHEQTEVLELDALAQYLVRADQDVDFAAFDLFENLARLLRAFEAAQVLDADGELLQPLVERTVVLQCEDGRGDQHGDLLRVGDGLEGRADRDFGLAEPDVAADQPVIGTGLSMSCLTSCVAVC